MSEDHTDILEGHTLATRCAVHAFNTTTEEGRLAWLRARMRGIGGSDIPAVCLIPDRPSWSCRARVYESKIVDPEDWSDDSNEMTEAGQWLEEPIAKRAAFVEGLQIVMPERHFVVRGMQHHMASPDRIVTHPFKVGYGCLQIKNVSSFAGDKWEEQPPLYVQAQVQWELHVTGCEWGMVAALVGGYSLRRYWIERHQEFIDWCVGQADAFWVRYVQAAHPPPVTADEVDHATLARLFRAHEHEVELPDEADDLIAEWEDINERDDAGRLDTIKNQLRIWIGKGGGDVGVTPQGRTVSWKESRRGERVYRSLRLRKQKEQA